MRQALAAAEPERRQKMLEEHVREQMARVLRLEAAKIPAKAPLSSLGFDSLIAIEFRNRLESTLGLELQATLVWAHPTLMELIEHLAAKIILSVAAPREAADEAAASITAMSEEAAEAEFTADFVRVLEEAANIFSGEVGLPHPNNK